MARKRYTTEQIISLLREAEVRLSRGETIGGICRAFGISEQSYYRGVGMHVRATTHSLGERRGHACQGQPTEELCRGSGL